MKTIFIEFFSCIPHVGQSFDIAQQYVDQGHQVEYYYLGDALPFIEFVHGYMHPLLKALGCKSVTQQLAAAVTGKNFRYIEPKLKLKHYPLAEIKDIEQVKQLHYKDFNIGLGMTSSLISYLRDPKPDLAPYPHLLSCMFDSAVAVYEFSKSLLSKQNKDTEVIFMNGRFCCYRALYQAILELNFPYKIHEGGCDSEHFTLYPSRPHDLITNQRYMLGAWQMSGANQDSIAAAEHFFAKNRQGIGEIGYIERFSKGQIEGQLPPLPTTKKIISFFTSTEDEYEGLFDLIEHRYWLDQFDLLQDLLTFIKEHSAYHLVVRIHPHMKKSAPKLLLKWREFLTGLTAQSDSITLIDEYSTCSSYSLIDISDKVVTYGSQTGIEAVFFGRPSIMAGPMAWYSEFECIYKPKSSKELFACLLSDELTANRESAYPYGYYMATRGTPLHYYRHKTSEGALFKGAPVLPRRPWLSYLNKQLFRWFPTARPAAQRPLTYIFGFAQHGIDYALLNRNTIQLAGFIDNNKNKHGAHCFGVDVTGPETAIQTNFDLIVVVSEHADSIFGQLCQLGVPKEKIIFHYPIVQLL